jgi:LysR family nitrogen assimilation transcriptional regulator
VERLLEENLFLVGKDRSALEPHTNKHGEFEARRLVGLPLVLPGREHGLRAVIEDTVNKAGVGLRVIAELDAPEQLKEMVRRTGCYTVASLAAIRNDPSEVALATARIVNPTIDRVVSIAHTHGRPLSRAARRVEQIVKQLIAEELASGWWKTASGGLEKRD